MFPDPQPAPATGNWLAVTRLVASSLAGEELGTVLSEAAAYCATYFGTEGAVIHLRAAEFSQSERTFAAGSPEFERLLWSTMQPQPNATAPAGGPAVDHAGAERRDEFASRFRTRLITPIRSSGVALGDLCLFRSGQPDFSSEQAEAARQIATILAVMLEQKRLSQAQARQHEVLALMSGLAEQLRQASDAQAIAEIGVRACATAFSSCLASLHRYRAEANRLEMAAAVGLPVPFVAANADLAVEEGVCGQTAEQRSLVVIEDIAGRPDLMAFWQLTGERLTFRSIWSLPLMGSDDRLLGTLAVYHPRIGAATEDEGTLLRLIGHQVAAALERALEHQSLHQ